MSRMQMFFDGSHTDGATGYGFALKRGEQTILEESKTIPNNTSNVAEYAGFIAGISAASALLEPNEGLEVYGDSQLVINQVAGKFKVKAEHLKKLCELAQTRVTALISEGHRIDLTWIPRCNNKQADKLAAKASMSPSRSGPNSSSN